MHSISFKEPLDVKLKAIQENTLGQFQLINNFLTAHAPRMIKEFHYPQAEATKFSRVLSDTLYNLNDTCESIERLTQSNAYLDRPALIAEKLRNIRRDIYACTGRESASQGIAPIDELEGQFKIIDSLRGYEYDAEFRTDMDSVKQAIAVLRRQEGIITRLMTSLERFGREGVRLTR